MELKDVFKYLKENLKIEVKEGNLDCPYLQVRLVLKNPDTGEKALLSEHFV